ncbi:Hypothetical predicted protein [Paramuricea clavata]|uniref:Uncharacterized protein n=1 Tax=Paramuricea clavata TaxID=317549 RepID=A0A7D9LYV7_PARCT|nr:Hypothetical predicted protein [Paramuricea clavata]
MSNPPITSDDLNISIKLLNDTIYTYFAGNFGFVERLPDKLLNNKYKNHSIKDLKKALKLLKLSNSELAEIRYVPRLVQNKLKSNTTNDNMHIVPMSRLTTINTLNVISGDMSRES